MDDDHRSGGSVWRAESLTGSPSLSADPADLASWDIMPLSQALKSRTVAAEEVVRHMFDRIDRLDPALRSFLQVFKDEALEAARQADREIATGQWRGPLHGVPLAVKDLFQVEGKPCSAGMLLRKDMRAGEDATVVARLRDAGAVILGATHMTEGATAEHHPAFPRPVNPWREGHWTGVSSSGSAVAVAARLCYGALGSDTGGSIRMPSAACGLSGIKPTWGRVSRHGMFPLAESFDHAGPMARSVVSAATILQVIAGSDPRDPTASRAPVPDYLAPSAPDLSGIVVGVDLVASTQGIAPAMVAALKNGITQLQALGAEIRPIELPSSPASEAMLLASAEMAAVHSETLVAQPELYGPSLRAMLGKVGQIPLATVGEAVSARLRYRGQIEALFTGIDLLVTPMLTRGAPAWTEIEAFGSDMDAMLQSLMPFSVLFNITGNPALALPAGFDEDGLPLSLQLVARHFDEALLVRVGRLFQSVTDFHERGPPLP